MFICGPCWTVVFTCGPWCSPVDRGVHPWTMVFIRGPCWTMLFIRGPWCSPVDRGVHPWTVVFIRGPCCSSVDRGHGVHPRTVVFTRGPWCPWTVVFTRGPWCSPVDRGVHPSTCNSLPLLTPDSHCFPLPTTPQSLGDPGFFSGNLLKCHRWWLETVPTPLGCSSSTF